MSEFNIEDLNKVIAQGREGSLAQLLALQLKGQIRKSELMAADNEKAMNSLRQADAAVKLAHERYSAIAAENVQARERHLFIRALAVSILEHSGGRHDWRGAMEDASDLVKTVDAVYSNTPATDRIVAGIKADGRAEGINFAASRLAAAFNHGHVDKPMAEVGDVVRMILTAKEDLANDPALPSDGLSGEYAEKSLAEWEAALREGADK